VTLREVGFYRELQHGHRNGPKLVDAVRQGPHPREREIVGYLTDATTLAAAPGPLVDDVLDGSSEGVAPLEIATDGTWVWPRDLSYYVGRYHVQLPAEFVDHMQRHGWEPRTLTAAELETLTSHPFTRAPRRL